MRLGVLRSQPIRRAALALGLAAAMAPAWSLDWDAGQLAEYGGIYSTACGNPALPRLRVTAQALMVEVGNKRLSGGNVMAALSYFGQEPPKNYRMALLSEVRNGISLAFIVYGDKRGQYIELEADPKVAAVLGKTWMAAKYRRCNEAGTGPAAAEPSQAAAPAGPAPAPSPGGFDEPLKHSRFKAAYLKAIGPKAKERWLAQLVGPSPGPKQVEVDGVRYQLVSVCKPHDCADNNLVVLYSIERDVLYGKLLERGNVASLFGWPTPPSPPVAAALERLWRAEWRSNP